MNIIIIVMLLTSLAFNILTIRESMKFKEIVDDIDKDKRKLIEINKELKLLHEEITNDYRS